MTPLISAEALQALLTADQTPVRLLDVRWKLGQPDGRPEYLKQHIPGAIYVDLEAELSGVATGKSGRHPLPEASDFEQTVRSWGVNTGDIVVIYDDLGAQAAARAWWLLRYAGAQDVRVLDGGLGSWISHDFSTESGEPSAQPEPGNFTAEYGQLPTIAIADITDFHNDGGKLLDARARERYIGEVEPIDPKAGHIPGALSTPTSGNLDESGHFLSPEQLRARFAAHGITPSDEIVSYCGSGITASHNILALTVAGYPTPILFPGSWSQWSNQPDLPVETVAQN